MLFEADAIARADYEAAIADAINLYVAVGGGYT